MPAAGEDGKFAVFGALDYATGRLVCQTAEHKDGAAFVAFLDHLAAAFPDGPLVVVLDNVGYHKGRRAKDWWMAQQDRVRPLWLPAYAPELNLIERVWRHLKDKLSCHRWWADLPAREVAAAALLSRTEARFHQPDPGGIALVQNFVRLLRACFKTHPQPGSRLEGEPRMARHDKGTGGQHSSPG